MSSEAESISVYSIQLSLNILPIVTAIILLTYLGPTFSNNVEIDPNDWRRKWLIFFAWLNLILTMISIIFTIIIISKYKKNK